MGAFKVGKNFLHPNCTLLIFQNAKRLFEKNKKVAEVGFVSSERLGQAHESVSGIRVS